MRRDGEERGDEAISRALIRYGEIAALAAPGMAQASLSTRATPVKMVSPSLCTSAATGILPPAALVHGPGQLLDRTPVSPSPCTSAAPGILPPAALVHGPGQPLDRPGLTFSMYIAHAMTGTLHANQIEVVVLFW